MNKLKLRLMGFWAYKDLLRELVIRDLKLKYRRSFLGYIWSVLNPLLTMVVLIIVFSSMFEQGIPNYPVYLLSGQILYNYMKQSTDFAMSSILMNASLIKKIYVPKYIFTVAKVSSGLIDLVFSLAALFVVMVFTGAPVTGYLLLVPFVLLQLYVFTLGLGLFLAQMNVFFRDINYIYSVLTMAWMYLTPIFYPFELLDPTLGWLIMHFNPMYLYIHQFRSIVVYGAMIDATFAFRGCVISIVMLLVGMATFIRKQDEFILYI